MHNKNYCPTKLEKITLFNDILRGVGLNRLYGPRKKASTKKSFANMITIIRLHLMSYVELLAFIKDTYKAWRKVHNC